MAERCHHVGCDDRFYWDDQCEYDRTLTFLAACCDGGMMTHEVNERLARWNIQRILRCYRGRTDRDAPAA